jgi:hypothetical protein
MMTTKFNTQNGNFIVENEILNRYPSSLLTKLMQWDNNGMLIDKVNDAICIDIDSQIFKSVITSMENNDFKNLQLIKIYNYLNFDTQLDIDIMHMHNLSKIWKNYGKINKINKYCIKHGISVVIFPSFVKKTNNQILYIPQFIPNYLAEILYNNIKLNFRLIGYVKIKNYNDPIQIHIFAYHRYSQINIVNHKYVSIGFDFDVNSDIRKLENCIKKLFYYLK